jgi:hypothetical protein
MGFLDKVKTATEQAVARGKEEFEEQKTKRELGQAYGDLGEKAFGLVDSGTLSHAELSAGVERIRSLKAKLAQLEEAAASAPEEAEPEQASTTPG